MTDNLKRLSRPLVFFDLETTGLDTVQDRVCQISLIKIEPGGDTSEINELINPTIPIPPAMTAIHGISDADVLSAPTFRMMAEAINTFIAGCDIAGYNIIIFDLPMLTEELGRCNIDLDLTGLNIIDACLIYKKLRPRTLAAAFRDYVGGEIDNAHDAHADTAATIDVMGFMAEKEPVIGTTPREWMDYAIDRKKMVDLSGKFIWNDQGEMLFNFGPQKGNKVIDNLGMLKWMVGKNFPRETMRWVYAIESDRNVAYKSVDLENTAEPLLFE